MAAAAAARAVVASSIASRVAFVTGGASGLGRATALRFARAGARVAVVDLPSSHGVAFAAELNAARAGAAVFAPADVTSEADVQAALSACEAAFGEAPNVVVNCAGIAPPAKVLGKKGPHSLDLFLKLLAVNTGGTFNVTRLAAARLAAAAEKGAQPAGPDGERGCVIFTASVAAFEGQIGQAAYSASKGAVVAMMLPMARELARIGVRINTIAPGVFLTPMLESLPPKVQTELGANVPFPQRLGRPDDYAALAQHIAENNYINGEVIRIDGALRMGPG
jgi:NAD(P)-dependent dehydrogenase (short-subunit alcohol dehydrogenase family)